MLYIKRCLDPNMWYANKVGQYVPFVREYPECYMSYEDTGYLNIVMKCDADICLEKDPPHEE